MYSIRGNTIFYIYVFIFISQWRSCVLHASRSTTCSTRPTHRRPAWSPSWRGNFTSCLRSTFPATSASHWGTATRPCWVSNPETTLPPCGGLAPCRAAQSQSDKTAGQTMIIPGKGQTGRRSYPVRSYLVRVMLGLVLTDSISY